MSTPTPLAVKKFVDPQLHEDCLVTSPNRQKQQQQQQAFSVECTNKTQWPKTTDAKRCQYGRCEVTFGFFAILPGQRGNCNRCGIVCCPAHLEHKIELPPLHTSLVPVCPTCYAQVLEAKSKYFQQRLEANGGGSSTPSSSLNTTMMSTISGMNIAAELRLGMSASPAPSSALASSGHHQQQQLQLQTLSSPCSKSSSLSNQNSVSGNSNNNNTTSNALGGGGGGGEAPKSPSPNRPSLVASAADIDDFHNPAALSLAAAAAAVTVKKSETVSSPAPHEQQQQKKQPGKEVGVHMTRSRSNNSNSGNDNRHDDDDDDDNKGANSSAEHLQDENERLKAELADMQTMMEETQQRLGEAVMERDTLEEQVQHLIEELDEVKNQLTMQLSSSGGMGGSNNLQMLPPSIRIDMMSASGNTNNNNNNNIRRATASALRAEEEQQNVASQQSPPQASEAMVVSEAFGRRAGKAKPARISVEGLGVDAVVKMKTPREADVLHEVVPAERSSSLLSNAASTSISLSTGADENGGSQLLPSAQKHRGSRAKPASISIEGLDAFAKMTPRDLASELGLSATGRCVQLPTMTPAARSDSGPSPTSQGSAASAAAAGGGGMPRLPPVKLQQAVQQNEMAHNNNNNNMSEEALLLSARGTKPPPPPPRRGGRAKPVPLEQVLSSFAKLTPRDMLADFGFSTAMAKEYSASAGGGDPTGGPTATPRAGGGFDQHGPPPPNRPPPPSSSSYSVSNDPSAASSYATSAASTLGQQGPRGAARGGGKSKPATISTDVSPQIKLTTPREDFSQSYIASGTGFTDADLLTTMLQLQEAGAVLEEGDAEEGEEHGIVYLKVPIAANFEDVFDDMATPRLVGSTQAGGRLHLMTPRNIAAALVTPRSMMVGAGPRAGGGGEYGGGGGAELEAENAALRVQLMSARRQLQEHAALSRQ